jgi:hypothetical protein
MKTKYTASERQIINLNMYNRKGMTQVWSVQVLKGRDPKFGGRIYEIESRHATREQAQAAMDAASRR